MNISLLRKPIKLYRKHNGYDWLTGKILINNNLNVESQSDSNISSVQLNVDMCGC